MSVTGRVSGGQGLDALVQAALVPGSLVLRHEALVDHAVNDGHGIIVCGSRCYAVALITGFYDILDLGAHHGAQAHIMHTGLFRLAGALLC